MDFRHAYAYIPGARDIADVSDVHFTGTGFNYRYVADDLGQLRAGFAATAVPLRPADAALFAGHSVVGIHFRRGDYLDPRIRSWLGVVTPQDQIAECGRVLADVAFPRPVKVVAFSNGAIRGNFERIFGAAPEDGGYGELETFRLMSMCDWLITANSTYSIFAAYLAPAMIGASMPARYAHRSAGLSQVLLAPNMRLYPNTLL